MNEPTSGCENGDPDSQVWRNELHSRLNRYRRSRGRRIEGQFSMRFPLPDEEPSVHAQSSASDAGATGSGSDAAASIEEIPAEAFVSFARIGGAEQPEIVSGDEPASESDSDEQMPCPNVLALSANAEIEAPFTVAMVGTSLVPVSDSAAVRALCSEAIEALTPESAPTADAGPTEVQPVEQSSRLQLVPRPGARRKVIAFPKPVLPPVEVTNRLADPVVSETPRILDVPEELQSVATRPFLDGLDIDSLTKEARPPAEHVELPFPPASIGQRILANTVDLAVVALGTALCGVVVHLMLPAFPKDKFLLIAALGAAIVLWSTYEYMFLVYGGATTGMRTAKLRLISYKGSPVKMPRRRLRTLSMFLSTASLMMGFLWALVDADGLGWHDRISQTYWIHK